MNDAIKITHENLAAQGDQDLTANDSMRLIDNDFYETVVSRNKLSFDVEGLYFDNPDDSKKQIIKNISDILNNNTIAPVVIDTRGNVTDGQLSMQAYEYLDIDIIPVYQSSSRETVFDNPRTQRAVLEMEDPPLFFKPYKSFDMSSDARIERAKMSGFDTEQTWYHGTDADIDELKVGGKDVTERHGNVFGDGIYLTKHQDLAEQWAGEVEGANVMPLRVKGKFLKANDTTLISDILAENMADFVNTHLNDGDRARIALDAGGEKKTLFFDKILDADEFYDVQEKNWKYFSGYDHSSPDFTEMKDNKFCVEYVDIKADIDFKGLRVNDVFNAIQRSGGGNITSALSDSGYDGVHINDDQTVVFESKNIKSVFSSFDLDKEDSSSLIDRFPNKVSENVTIESTPIVDTLGDDRTLVEHIKGLGADMINSFKIGVKDALLHKGEDEYLSADQECYKITSHSTAQGRIVNVTTNSASFELNALEGMRVNRELNRLDNTSKVNEASLAF